MTDQEIIRTLFAKYREGNRELLRTRAKEARAALRRKGVCIGGSLHGKATQGVRCDWCAAVHKRGLDAVLADPNAPSPPAGWRGRSR